MAEPVGAVNSRPGGRSQLTSHDRRMNDVLWTIVWYCIVLVWYCSALLIPGVYLICTRFRGALVRKMLRGVWLQFLWSVAWAILGCLLLLLHVPDMYAFPFYLTLINFVFFVYFMSVLIKHVRGGRESRKNAYQSDEPNADTTPRRLS